ncbi:hypothetical protein Acy02nite_34160 [Actinoplanes cyaneus]|uniref:Uncharacterized protein n=1 Tax=Actinoplanes cyaneus TaxID=52696 RepID=A0A919IGC6_9ACTN|nr:hypothetical protein [Actinoplanes cyaneus]GID65535.1 hypothetical protein Acy02nite_34160 [Actinoplanes cyaneus]
MSGPGRAWWGVITIQRVRVRWPAAARGAPHANARRGLNTPVALPPSLPPGEVVIHDVLADEATGYRREETVLHGDLKRARDLNLWLTPAGPALIVDRLPGRAAFPRPAGRARLFTLQPGEAGRYRANFRFVGCLCDPSWYYEEWLIRIGLGAEALTRPDPAHDLDDRTHLYGGRVRSRRLADVPAPARRPRPGSPRRAE